MIVVFLIPLLLGSPFLFEIGMLLCLVFELMFGILSWVSTPPEIVVYVPKSCRTRFSWFSIRRWCTWLLHDIGVALFDAADVFIYGSPHPFRCLPKPPYPISSSTGNHRKSRAKTKTPSIPATTPFQAHSMASVHTLSTILHSFPTRLFTAAKTQSRESVYFDADSFQILVDNGASFCMTNNKAHFVDRPMAINESVEGIGATAATLIGTVEWKWEDDLGRIHTKRIPNTRYVSTLPFCLLSPQHLARELQDHHPTSEGVGCITLSTTMELFWDQRQFKRTIPLHRNTGHVGFIRSASGFRNSNAYCGLLALDGVQDPVCLPVHVIPPDDDDASSSAPARENILDPQDDEGMDTVPFDFSPTSTQHPTETPPALIEDEDLRLEDNMLELLRQHYKTGHLPFSKLQRMASIGQLPKRLADCRIPKCSACMYSKATRRAWRTKSTANAGKLRTATRPGEIVSIDQIESSTKGLIAQVKGRPTKARYTTATVFVDHFSRLSYVHFQVSTSAEDTLKAKRSFESYAKSVGVRVLHYHADNGRFAENLFVQDVEEAGQTISYCGVNAHFQNGIAEKMIRDLQDQARTMLVHAKHRWHDAINANLWPYAVRMASKCRNGAPLNEAGDSPLELFLATKVKVNTKHFKPFGCPVYVLSDKMQQGRKGSKWEERARVGVYLGPSPRHASSVALVLSLTTGMVSSQYHVEYDEFFETVRMKDQVIPRSLWQEKTGFINTTGPTPSEGVGETMSVQTLPTSTYASTPSEGVDSAQTNPSEGVPQVHDDNNVASYDNILQDPILHQRSTPHNAQSPIEPSPAEAILRRSSRDRRPPERYIATANASVAWEVLAVPDYSIQDRMEDPIAFSATSDPDTMYLHEAKREADWPAFRQAMAKEVNDHEERGHWKMIPMSEVPEGEKVLPSVWSMKRKRRVLTGEVYKHKARLNLHGGKQEHGVNFWETYAPVVTWCAIRLVLILSLLRGWKTRQIDFVLAFPQADIEVPMYMSIPDGFHLNGRRDTHCLKLLKNIYGGKAAGRVWNQHIHKGLMERGYTQSKVDHCTYYKGQTILLLYVDDGIFAGPDDDEITEFIKEIREKRHYSAKFDISDEGDLTDYLGVNVTKLPDGRIKLSQPQLIQKILTDLGFKSNTKTKTTPANATVMLTRDEEGVPFNEEWSYRSVIGKLNYLEKSTRGDIAVAVHQCARFSINPKASHAEAVKRIGRYLLGTQDEGLIINPTEDSFEVWCDAGFCGDWDPATAGIDPITAKSRSGFTIKYAGCPIVWYSKLQTETALSTTEAEFVCLSTALRETIMIMQLLEEMTAQGVSGLTTKPIVHCKVFEDNLGALEIARIPKMRPRTKHLNVKLHHFREYVESGKISIHAVSTHDQQADMFSKNLSVVLFRKFRKLVFGW